MTLGEDGTVRVVDGEGDCPSGGLWGSDVCGVMMPVRVMDRDD